MVGRRTPDLHVIPADRLAQEAGSPQALNMVMLGAFSRHNALLKTESLIWAIQQTNNRFLASNLAAFWKGNGFSQQEGPME
jgi:Pyruvate/2-oxoacid:ferredoxin oxidoreductase gamma subunit